MPDRYSRFGQLFIHALHKQLQQINVLEVAGVGACKPVAFHEPTNHGGGWSFTFDLEFPNSESKLTLGVTTFGSCLLSDTESIPLPDVDFADPMDEEFPPEHQRAWYALYDDLVAELNALGLAADGDEVDFYLISDYYPSRGISGFLLKPSIVTLDLAHRCQKLLNKHQGWNFWIQFDFGFKGENYTGHDERLLIRQDRITTDFNATRLRAEFPEQFSWSN